MKKKIICLNILEQIMIIFYTSVYIYLMILDS